MDKLGKVLFIISLLPLFARFLLVNLFFEFSDLDFIFSHGLSVTSAAFTSNAPKRQLAKNKGLKAKAENAVDIDSVKMKENQVNIPFNLEMISTKSGVMRIIQNITPEK